MSSKATYECCVAIGEPVLHSLWSICRLKYHFARFAKFISNLRAGNLGFPCSIIFKPCMDLCALYGMFPFGSIWSCELLMLESSPIEESWDPVPFHSLHCRAWKLPRTCLDWPRFQQSNNDGFGTVDARDVIHKCGFVLYTKWHLAQEPRRTVVKLIECKPQSLNTMGDALSHTWSIHCPTLGIANFNKFQSYYPQAQSCWSDEPRKQFRERTANHEHGLCWHWGHGCKVISLQNVGCKRGACAFS